MCWTKHFKQKLIDRVRSMGLVVSSLNDLRLRNTKKRIKTYNLTKRVKISKPETCSIFARLMFVENLSPL